ESHHVVWRLNSVQDAVHHQWRRFELFQRIGLEDPLDFQVPHVARRNLRQSAISLAGISSRIHKPVPRLILCVQKSLEGHLSKQRSAGGKAETERKKCAN